MDHDKNINLLEVRIQKLIETMRPSVHMRDELDIGYSFRNNTLELFEIRPRWDKKDEKINSPFAKTKFIKSRGIWQIYWLRANGKWVSYDPNPEVNDIVGFFEIVKEDKHNCFFG